MFRRTFCVAPRDVQIVQIKFRSWNEDKIYRTKNLFSQKIIEFCIFNLILKKIKVWKEKNESIERLKSCWISRIVGTEIIGVKKSHLWFNMFSNRDERNWVNREFLMGNLVKRLRNKWNKIASIWEKMSIVILSLGLEFGENLRDFRHKLITGWWIFARGSLNLVWRARKFRIRIWLWAERESRWVSTPVERQNAISNQFKCKLKSSVAYKLFDSASKYTACQDQTEEDERVAWMTGWRSEQRDDPKATRDPPAFFAKFICPRFITPRHITSDKSYITHGALFSVLQISLPPLHSFSVTFLTTGPELFEGAPLAFHL